MIDRVSENALKFNRYVNLGLTILGYLGEPFVSRDLDMLFEDA